MPEMLERIFRLKENGTTWRTEVVAGATTFAAMAYIVFVNPAILSAAAGGPASIPSLLSATCIAAAVGSILMGVAANYPVALAPGMGENIFFVSAVLAWGLTFREALGVVLVAGALFVLLTFLQVRKQILDSVPDALKYSIGAGIGLLLAFVGLSDAGIVVRDAGGLMAAAGEAARAHAGLAEGPLREGIVAMLLAYAAAPGYVGLGDIASPPTLLALVGIVLTTVLVVRRVRGAILFGVAGTAAIALATGMVKYRGVAEMPAAPPFLDIDVISIFAPDRIGRTLSLVGIFLFMSVFDAMGTLIGVGARAGLLRDGKLLRANRALLADAGGTMAGAIVGTSTVTAYIESAAGVEAGGRTGLSAVVTGILFLGALFFSPIVAMVGGGVPVEGTLAGAPVFLNPVIAPALIVVGAMMVKPLTMVDWDDWSEALPAFLTAILMPLTMSISNGVAAGFVLYAIAKVAKGEARKVGWVVYMVAAICAVRFAAGAFGGG